MTIPRRFGACVAMLVLAGSLGCDAPRVESSVTGLVTGDGKPLSEAVIVFQSLDAVAADERTFRTVTGADGRYDLGGIRPGSYEVIVVPAGGRGGQADQQVASDALGPAGGEPLRVDVGPQPADFDIALVRRR